MADELRVDARITIPYAEFQWSYSRSPGPGGQHVNKSNTKATLRWSAVHSPALPPDVRRRLLQQQGTRITREGDLVLSSHQYRDQRRNVEDCLDKLRRMVLQAAARPRPRKKTKVPASSKRKRLDAKRRRGQLKQLRSNVRRRDD